MHKDLGNLDWNVVVGNAALINPNFHSPDKAIVESLLRSAGGDHFAQMACIAGNVTPCEAQIQSWLETTKAFARHNRPWVQKQQKKKTMYKGAPTGQCKMDAQLNF